MSKHNRRGRNNQQRFVQLFHWMLNSAAWKNLSANARSIYIEISARYNGMNNGFIVYSVRQAADALKIGKSTAARAFNDLQTHGFIVAEQRGHFHWKINPNGSKIRPASEWRLTIYDSDRETNYANKLATKEFMCWTQIQNAVPPKVRLVSDTGPYGTQSGSMITQNTRNGTSSRTIKTDLAR